MVLVFLKEKHSLGQWMIFLYHLLLRRHDFSVYNVLFLIAEPLQTQSVNEWFDQLNLEMKVVNQFTAYFAWELRYVMAYGFALAV